jgi:histidine triad (HIT) family protein
MQESVFTKIVKGEIPSHKVYEDEKTLAFMDIHPVVEGHVLVIPKVQAEFIWDLEEEDYRALMDTVQKVGNRLRDVMGKPYVGVMVVGTDVPHAHVQVMPFTRPAEMKKTLDHEERPTDHKALSSLAARIAF